MDNQRYPDLCLDGILVLPVKTFHPEILLNHLKERLHLPVLFVDGGNFKKVRIKHICQERNLFFGCVVIRNNLPEGDMNGIFFDCPILGCCMALRKEALQYILPFPKKCIGHDLWIGCLCAAKNKMTYAFSHNSVRITV